MLKGHIRPTVTNNSGNKPDSKSYRPVKNSSNFLKGSEYLFFTTSRKNIFLIIKITFFIDLQEVA